MKKLALDAFAFLVTVAAVVWFIGYWVAAWD